MFLIDENKRQISGACFPFVLYLACVAISPFIYFNEFIDKAFLSSFLSISGILFFRNITIAKSIGADT